MNFLTESKAPSAFSSRSLECKRIFFFPLDPLLKLSCTAVAHLHCTPSPSLSHCERSPKIRGTATPHWLFFGLFHGSSWESLFERCVPVALLYLLHTGGMEASRFAWERNDRPALSALCHSCTCSHTMPRIAGKQIEHKWVILWPFTIQERLGNGRHGTHGEFISSFTPRSLCWCQNCY